MRCQLQVVRIDAHQRLAALDGLARIDEPLNDFARHTKAQIALDSGGHDSRECTSRGGRILDDSDPDQRRLAAGIGCRGLAASG
ncbi:hypothetical protein Tamer19_33090 [Cupriavidus sp. TA19]|nr:hypothetical protein Tamer19_33090 [Cupriavidus sp. TA19]